MSNGLFADCAKSFAGYRDLFVYSIMVFNGLDGEHIIYQPPGVGESIKLELNVSRTKKGPGEKLPAPG